MGIIRRYIKCVDKCFFQVSLYKIYKVETPHFVELGAKLKLKAPIISSVGNLQLFVEKLQLLVPYFSTQDAGQTKQTDGDK